MKTKMENNFWKTFSIILIVILVVGAVIVFWRNPELSPNAGVIKVQQSKYGPEVYTKAEIDAMSSGLMRDISGLKQIVSLKTSNQEVLGMLNKCQFTEISRNILLNNPNGLTCDQICLSKKCVFGYRKSITDLTYLETNGRTGMVDCDIAIGPENVYFASCLCCSL